MTRPPTRGRETKPELRRRALRILALLRREYPDAHCALDYRTPFELIVATILSAQCTDVRVNLVTPAFFARYPTTRALAEADQGEVEELIRSTGFFRNKARSLIGMALGLVHGPRCPEKWRCCGRFRGSDGRRRTSCSGTLMG